MKKLSISLLLLAIMILSISVVSATDADMSADLATTHDDDSTVQAVDEVDEPVSTNDEGDAKLGDSYKTFTDLRNDIDSGGSEIKLNSSYKYDSVADTAAENAVRYENGVFINRNITIDGDGHTIDASDVNRAFIVYGFTSATIRNTVFINGNAELGSAIYSGGYLTIENCTFIKGTDIYDDDSAVSSGSVYQNTATSRFVVVSDEASYNAALADPASPVNRMYYAFNREDAIKEDGTPAGVGDFVAGHSWEAAMNSPTDPASTSTAPWVYVNLAGILDEDLVVEYGGEVVLIEHIVGPYSVTQYSVPNEFNGMEDYRLEWGTGNPGVKVLDNTEVNVGVVDYKSFTDLRNAIDATPAGSTLVLENNYKYDSVADTAAENAVRYINGVFINKNLTIDGAGHIIDASDVNRTFIVYGFTSATIKNTVFINGKGDKGKSIYSAGDLTFENCTFIDNGAYYDDDSAVSSGSVYQNTATSRFVVVSDEASYNAALADPASPVNRMYYAFNREDAIKEDGTPAGVGDFVAGHSWEAAMNSPTDPASTSTAPWVYVNLAGILDEDLVVEYGGEVVLIEHIVGPYSVTQYSVPNEFNGMEDYRLEWGTGNPGVKVLDNTEVNVVAKTPFVPIVEVDEFYGHDTEVLVDVFVPKNYTGEVELFLDGVSKGKLIFIEGESKNNNLGLLSEGSHNVSVIFPEDDQYIAVDSATYASMYNVTKTIRSKLNVTQFTVETRGEYLSDDNVTIAVTLLGVNGEGLNETFKIIVNNTEYTVTVTNGTGSFNISGLAPGHYSALGIFSGNNMYNGAYATGLFTVLYPRPILKVTAEDITYGADAVININLTEADGTQLEGRIGIDVGGKFTLETNILGFVSINVPNLPANESGWAIGVYYYGDEEHLNAWNDTETVKVAKIDPMVVIAVIEDVDTKEPAVVSIFVGNITGGLTVARATGQIRIEGYGVERLEDLKDGIYTLDLIDIVPGDYEITVTYLGDDNFNSESNSTKFTVPKRVATVEITDVTENIIYGQNATFTVNMNPDSANGNVTIYINGTESGIIVLDDEYANTSVSISDLGVGTHTIGVKYNGNNQYNASDVVNTIITVDKASSSVEIGDILVSPYPGEALIEFTVVNATTIDISVLDEYNRKVYNKTIVASGIVSDILELSNLPAGTYGVIITNEENEYYNLNGAISEFTIEKSQATMLSTITENIKAGDANVVVEVVLPENATGKVMLLIDGEPVNQMGYELINGTVNITVPTDFVNAGKRSYYVSYDGDDNYDSAYDYKSFEVSKVDPMVVISVIADLDTMEPAAVSIFVGNITGGLTVARATGQILIEGYGVARLENLVDGIYTLKLIDIVPGDYEITVTYLGDDNFNNASNSTKFTVPKRTATVEISDVTENIIYGQNATFTVNMNPDSANGNVTIYINGTESGIIVLDDEYANASVSISDLGVGTHTIGVKYNGNDEFIASDVAYTTINVAPKSGSNVVIVPVSAITYGDNITIQYTVLNATTIKINVGNGGLQPVYNDTIVANVSEYSGSFILPNLAAGDYLVVVYNEGNDNYTFSVDTVEFTVNKAEPTMQTEITPDIKVGDVDVVIKVVLPEDATGNVMLVIDEQPVTQMGYNLINGTVNITVPADILTAGKHSYYVNYGGDNNYTSVYDLHSFEVSKLDPMVVITVIPDADTKEPAAVSIFVGNITGGLTVARATGQILIKGYGLGDLQNLVDGIYTLNLIDIVPGDYEINVTYFGDGKFNNASNSTKFTVPKRAATVEISDVTENIIYGQNATFTVNMNPDSANGNVTIYINGTEYGIIVLDDEYANITVLISDLGEGTHTIGVKYNGNDHYNASEVVNTIITVAKAGSKVTIKPIGEVTYGNDVTIQYTVLNATNIKINVGYGGLQPVYNDTFDANVSEYTGSFVLSNLTAGEYLVLVYNEGNDNYTFSVDSIYLTVNKAQPIMQTEITPDIKVGDESVVIKVVLPENATGNVILSIDGEPVSQMGYELINGTANITLPADFVTAGKHSYYVNYAGDDNYTSAYDFKSFEVSKVTPTVNIVLNESEIGVAGGALVNISVAGDATGKLLIDNNGDLSIVELTNGNYTLELYDLIAGEYYINVTYSGDDKYNEASASKVFTIPKVDVNIVYETVTPEIKYGEDAIVKVDITPNFATGNVTIFVDDSEYGIFVLDDDYANATISISGLAIGSHNVTVTYNGDENYNVKTGTAVNAITVTKGQPRIDIMLYYDVIEVGSEITVLYGIFGDVNGGNITISIDGVECYNNPIAGSVDYIDILSDLLTAGTHTIAAQYLGDDMYLPSNIDEVNVTVLNMSEIKINIDTPENTTDLEFNVTLPSNATGYLFVDIAGQHYYAPVKNGTASVIVPGLAPGNYTTTIAYSGDYQYDNVTLTKNITVVSNVPDNAFNIPDTAKDGEPLTYAINLPSDAKGYLEVDVDGTKYVAALVNGSASISVPGLSAGNHNVTVSYTGDSKHSPVTKSMSMNVPTPVYKITKNNNVAAIYSANANYKVLITKNGKAVGAGESVVITYNGKKTTVKTDSKGYATLKLNTQMKVKTYTVTAEYKGVKVSNKVTIKHVIKANNVNVKKSKNVNKIKVKTYKVNGKFLNGKKLILKLKNKKIKAKINKKGVATFKVKKSVLTKLKVGKKYKYTVTYGKDTVTKKVKVKR